jgi:glycosyltransferase involved in cell wall biosynthesis
VTVVVEHCRRLARLPGWEVFLVLARERDERDWIGYPELDRIQVIDRDQALDLSFDVAVATWWETTYTLFQLRARRYAFFIQSLEDRFYLADQAGRLAAKLTFDLPVAFITEAAWIKRLLARLRPDAPCFWVRNGIDKDVFKIPSAPPVSEGPLRILVEGPLAVWFKGVAETIEAIHRMVERHQLTVVTGDPGAVSPLLAEGDRAVGPLTQRELAQLYASHDVLVKLSRVEGVFGPPLEAFHCGATAVTTPVTGHDEYIDHGYNALICDWDDLTGVGRTLDLLARNRRYLTYLRYNALRTAASWPSWDQQSQFMQAALLSIARIPRVGSPLLGKRLTEDIRANAAFHQQHLVERADFHRRAIRYERLVLYMRQTRTGKIAAQLAGKQAARRLARPFVKALRRRLRNVAG